MFQAVLLIKKNIIHPIEFLSERVKNAFHVVLVQFCIYKETGHLNHCKSSDWFLYEIQYWAEIVQDSLSIV